MDKLVIATNNAHKLGELRRMLDGLYEVVGLADIGCHDDIPEDADTFEGNALAKALWVSERYGYDCIADDSGLEVAALGGEPGVYSARYCGRPHDDKGNNELLLSRLADKSDRSACFRTALVLVRKGHEPVYFNGRVDGTIGHEPAGTNGFGYDPLFTPAGWTKTFAQASAAEKDAVSHRGRAVEQLLKYLIHLRQS